MEAVIKLCNLDNFLYKPISKLSKGQRQRVGMAQTLLHEPDVLILDEPTAGLDPNQIREVRETIQKLGKDRTILLSTHILQEVEAMTNRVILINLGNIVFDGTIDEIRQDQETLDAAFNRYTNV
jgi:ABC-2 type transport system ATP-binding protein